MAGARRPRRSLDLLREPAYRYYLAARFASATAMTLLQAALAWHVYELTGSVIQLGVLGLVRFGPSLLMSLIGGAVADSFDRKRIIVLAQLVPLAGSLALVVITRSTTESILAIYAVVSVIAVAAAFENPARQALLPTLVPRERFADAVTITATSQQIGFVTGPAAAGGAIASLGVDAAYGIHAALVAVAIVAMLAVQARFASEQRRAVSIRAIREGLAFVRSRQVILGSMSLDMFAVVFGGATALLPVYAEDILHVGPRGYGLLAASFEAGALLMALALIVLPPVDRTGRALLATVALFGLATIVFGLSRSFALSIAAYMAVGMADQVSVVMRQTTIQLATPDELRGRVSSVNQVFIGASNQVGAVESGFVAALAGPTFAVVSGGIACLAVVSFLAARLPDLRGYSVTRDAVRREPVTAGQAGQDAG